MSNPIAPYFARMDVLLPKLADKNLSDVEADELADLVRRALFFLAATLNEQARSIQHLILPVPGDVVDTDDAEGTSPTPPEGG